jgi:prepilin-type N-terminal cleavage/methylation domain-containing protein
MLLRISRKGFSLIELLVVMLIVSILAALLVTAVQGVRAAATKITCVNNLRQIGVALHHYHDITKTLPPAHVGGQDLYGRPPCPDSKFYFSWMTRILPHLEQKILYMQVNWNASPFWQHPLNETVLPIFHCPADHRADFVASYGSDRVALTEYLAVNGTDQLAFNGLIFVNSQIRLVNIPDGASNTFMVGERPPSADLAYGWWFAGSGDLPAFGATDVCLGTNEIDVTTMARDIYRPGEVIDPGNVHRWHFWSLHRGGGSHFLLGDGTVRFVSYGVGQAVMNAMATRDGGEELNLPD